MVKSLFYRIIKYYCRILVHFFFGKVEIIGRENIPKNLPVIYSSNHQNAFMDALIIGGLSQKLPIRSLDLMYLKTISMVFRCS